MKLWLALAVVALLACIAAAGAKQDDDFAEFDDDFDEIEFQKGGNQNSKDSDPEIHENPVHHPDDEDDVEVGRPSPDHLKQSQDEEEEAVVEEEESEWKHFEDNEEFVNYKDSEGDEEEEDDDSEFVHEPKIKSRGDKAETKRDQKAQTNTQKPQTLNIAKIPAHLRNNWENYYLEILMTVGLVIYFLNFFTGKAKNQKIANAWFSSNKALLESNFALVGDDGSKNIEDIETQMQKESENMFTLWCSGRSCCEGMLVEIKLLKRQDIVSLIANAMKPGQNKDQVRVKVHMNPDDMDNFVFCLAQKKAAAKMAKELNDVMTYCPERKTTILDKYGLSASVSSNFCVMSEIAEVTSAMLDSKMVAVLSKFPDALESIHFSDQYTGIKPPEDQPPEEWPVPKKVLIFTFNLTEKKDMSSEEAMEAMKPLMMLVFYFMDKVKRFRLSREAKNKADKNRSKVSERFWKSIHALKAVRAQEEREKKRREKKERIKEIEDPDKQRKLEEKENRRDRKKAAPKMKQLKVKAM